MTKKVLENGLICLQSEKGIIDIRSNMTYSEVQCKPEKEKYYKEAE